MSNRIRVSLGPANFAENEMRGFGVGKRNVLVACIGGKYMALDDWCNHAGCLLSGGRLEKNLVICPCHEVGFDMDTGRNMTSPSVCDDQRRYTVVVENGLLVLEDFDPMP
jgi:3-phenylpropionate/trans-cinnamate dioxygenase ferredoxin subunit